MPRIVPDVDELHLFLDGLLAATGPGRVLVCGEEAARIAAILRMSALQVEHFPGIPEDRALAGGHEFDVVLLWHALDDLSPEACLRTLMRLRPHVTRTLAIRADCSERKSAAEGDKWFETAALEAGYRKHPLYLQLCPYERREFDGADDLLLLEPLPAAAPPDAASIDMLREAGRLADARVERYRLALKHVRPGDTVIDVACGSGYGSHVLFTGSAAARVIGIDGSDSAIGYASASYGRAGLVEFRNGDVQRLESVADHSVDVVVSFDTLERVREPVRLLDEARRVLRPGGRLVACVPNRWIDETGKDPNPHHHHVYAWDRLKQEVSERFLLERAYRQIAGAGMKHPDSARLLREFPATEEPGDAEWLIVVAMRDPLDGRDVPYVETTFAGYEDLAQFHVARFDGDYENPWLVKALVSIGFRFEDPVGLVALARRVRQQATPGSADEGAALCVEGYALVEERANGADARTRLRDAISAYVETAGNAPHQLRWKISNLYVQGLLHLADREFPEARAAFERCAAMDPVPFSPLLATKTIGAAYLAGLIAALMGDRERARELWMGGIRSAKAVFASDWTNVLGKESHPLYFGLPEVAVAVSKASKCAYALEGLDNLAHRPGRFWVEASRDLESQCGREARMVRHTLAALHATSAQAAASAASGRAVVDLQLALDRQAVAIADMHRAFETQAQTIGRLNAAILDRDKALAEQAATLAKQREAFDAQARNIATLQEQLNLRDVALATQSQTIAGMRRAFDRESRNGGEPGDIVDRLQVELGKREEALAAQAETIAELRRAFEEQSRNIDALREQLNTKDAAFAKQAETIAGLHRSFEQQAQNIEGLNAAVLEREKALAQKSDAFEAQARNIAALRDQLGSSTAAFTMQAETIAQMRRSFEQQVQNIGKLNAAVLEREKALAQKSDAFEAQARNIAALQDQLNSDSAAFTMQAETIAQMRRSFEQQVQDIAKLNAAVLERDKLIGDQNAAFARQREALEGQARNIQDLQAQLNERDVALAGLRRSMESLRAEGAAERERQASALAALENDLRELGKSLAESQELAARQARDLEQAGADLARERDRLRHLELKLQGSEAERARTEARLQSLRATWPYRLLRRWMDGEEKQ